MRRLCAAGALLAGAASIVVSIVVLWNNWAALLGALALMIVATMALWYVLTREGIARLSASIVVVAAVVVAFVTLARHHGIAGIIAVALLVVLAAALARVALRADRSALRKQAPPGIPVGAAVRPVLIVNPHSGGGKADAEFLAAAQQRGVATVTLGPGDDLEALAGDAIAGGADVLGM